MNRIPLKNPHEIESMRESCRITAKVLDDVAGILRPGISTEEVNSFCHKLIVENGGVPSPLNYKGYPKSVCISPNDVICHGIPAPFFFLNAGDIVNIDVTTYKNGFHGDSSRMYMIGGPEACTPEARELVKVTRDALYAAIREVKPGKRLGDLGAAIQELVRSTGHNYGIVREYTGHGIGREFHESPQVLHVGRRGTGDVLRPGMTFTIEPMINIGSARTILSKVDGWTVRTADGSLSAQWEHTVLVTEDGVDILTESSAG